MQYNQPLDQPTVPNAPYIDGNPAAGIQGSIVPAASIEYDQREIVEVINQANQRLYSDFSGTTCAPPSNSDQTQLRKAIEGYIQSWVISTNVTFKVHGTGADFPDLFAAMAYLSKYRITNTGSVTLQIQGAPSGFATQYVYNKTLIINHPNLERVKITGTMIGAPVQGTDFQYTGNRVVDASAQLSMLRGRFAAELHFVSGNFMAIDGSLGWSLGVGLIGILITGDGSTNTGVISGGLTFNNSTMSVGNISIHGFGSDGFVTNNSYIVGLMDFFSSSGNAYAGFELQGAALFGSTQTIGCSNAGNGVTLTAGTSIKASGQMYFRGNTGNGVWAVTSSGCSLAASYFLNNGQWGVAASQAQVYCANSTFSGNAAGAAYASYGGGIVVTGSSGIAGACNPAQGTQGNGFAYIM